jgi:hypothetical protein
MKLALWSVLVVVVACKGKSSDSPSGPPNLPATVPPAPDGATPAVTVNADGVPDTVGLVDGGTLVTKDAKKWGTTWRYAYANAEPQTIFDKQRAALDSRGWYTITRREVVAGAAVQGIWANRGDHVAIVHALPGATGGTELELVVQGMQNFAVQPPAGYPAGFPFLPFGIPADGSTTSRTSYVYNGEAGGLNDELLAATKAAGWNCGSGDFLKWLTGCRKDGHEIFVKLDSLSANRQSLTIAVER